MQDPSWGAPLSNNGVEKGMPTTGDRQDIGWLPGPHSIWYTYSFFCLLFCSLLVSRSFALNFLLLIIFVHSLLFFLLFIRFVSQSWTAKKYMMGWGDASHAVPWNYYVNTTGHYLNFWDIPNVRDIRCYNLFCSFVLFILFSFSYCFITDLD